MIVAVICILLFYIQTAIAEGFYFHAVSKARIKAHKYQHWLLVGIRIPLWVMFYQATGFNFWLTSAFITIFPFIHDGIYYYTRNKLNPFVYPKGFLDNPNPKSSNAIMDFTLIQRTLLAVAGVSFMLIRML